MLSECNQEKHKSILYANYWWHFKYEILLYIIMIMIIMITGPAEACDEYIAEARETRTVEQAEKTFRKAVNKANGLFISASARSLANERGRACRLKLADEALNDLNKQIQKLVVEDKRTKWQSAVNKCYHRIGIMHLWRLVKVLRGENPHNSPN